MLGALQQQSDKHGMALSKVTTMVRARTAERNRAEPETEEHNASTGATPEQSTFFRNGLKRGTERLINTFEHSDCKQERQRSMLTRCLPTNNGRCAQIEKLAAAGGGDGILERRSAPRT